MSDWPAGMTIRPLVAQGLRRSGFTRSPFSADWRRTLLLLSTELMAVRAKAVVLQVDIDEAKFRIDGYPRSDAQPYFPCVVLSFDSPKGSLSFPADRFDRWKDNVRAVALGMEALRKVDRYGITRGSEQYQGWKQLPAGTGAAASAMTTTTAQQIILAHCLDMPASLDTASYVKAARRATHPDRHGGDRTAWDQVQEASRVLGVAS